MSSNPSRKNHAGVWESARMGIRATVLGMFVSAILAGVKIVSGIIGHSYVLIADGFESLLDIFSSLVVWGSLRVAAAPPNERFPYGYGKIEPLAALVVATTLAFAALGIAIQSVREIMTPHHLPAPFTLVVLVVVVVTKELMFRFLRRAGQTAGSQAVETDAWHHRSDSLTSLAAFAGISFALLAGKGYESADDWAALFACLVIAFNGYRLFRSAIKEVLDAAPPESIEAQVRQLALKSADVRAIDQCRVRKSGLGFYVDIHVVVEGDLPVRRGHEIAHAVKDVLLKGPLNILDVTVHIEPDEPGNAESLAEEAG
jgi:cation diffusion facilitator family transporter